MDGKALGVNIGGTKLLMVLHKERRRIATTGQEFSKETLRKHIEGFVQERGLAPSSIGIAVPGVVSNERRVEACDVLPNLAGCDLAKEFSEFGCPVVVLNDVEAALSEEFHDAEPGVTGGVVMAGTAVGGAFQVEGIPLRGTSGWAGELGYLPVSLNGKVKRLDELAGGSFMAARLGLPPEDLARLASREDESVLAVIREGGTALGLALATVINFLNPSLIAFGGGCFSLRGYVEAAQAAASRYSLPEPWKACSLRPVRAGSDGVALGASRVASRRHEQMGASPR